MVTFIEKTHKYFNEEGVEYISGTTFLHKFQKPFDKEKFSTLKAKQLNVTKEAVLAMWDETAKKACEYGTSIHLVMENYINKKPKLEEYENLYNSFNEIVSDDFKRASGVHSEKILWTDKYRIAGTADLIIEHNDKEFSIGDFKTNKSIDFASKYGDRLLSPIEHLSDCNYNIYSLQMSLYAYMFSQLTGKKCRKVFLMYLKNDKWNYIPANNMEYEVRALLFKWAKDNNLNLN